MSGSVTKVTTKTNMKITEDQPASEFSSKTDTSDFTAGNIQHQEDQYRSTAKLSHENSQEDFIKQMHFSTPEKTECEWSNEKTVEVKVIRQSLPQPQYSAWNFKDSEMLKLEHDKQSDVDDMLKETGILSTSLPPHMTKREVSTTAVSTVQPTWKANCNCQHEHLSGCNSLDRAPLITVSVQTQTEWSWLNQPHFPHLNDVTTINTYGITEAPELGHEHLKVQHESTDESKSDIPILSATSCSKFEDILYQNISGEEFQIDVGLPAILSYRAESGQSSKDFHVVSEEINDSILLSWSTAKH
ncbi:uncharacterized protein LOC122802434 [Protopterus annectens]|uniref:uncharacterized protein LOC122802434 n=1 Tax=Protopterus annectens TaxID=7888 RepID=UPI001CFB239D|nr:uncharacterized protein LOC122802434 [Protopterus annectens]